MTVRAVPTVAFVLAGCLGPSHPPTERVVGVVAIGGRPAVGALVVLVPTGPFDPAADNPRGIVGADGSFAISTYAKADGAPVGEYKVLVLPPAVEEEGGLSLRDPAEGDRERAYERYRSPDSTPLTTTVSAGRNDLGRIAIEASPPS